MPICIAGCVCHFDGRQVENDLRCEINAPRLIRKMHECRLIRRVGFFLCHERKMAFLRGTQRPLSRITAAVKKFPLCLMKSWSIAFNLTRAGERVADCWGRKLRNLNPAKCRQKRRKMSSALPEEGRNVGH
jgi:hypothetical protein